VPQLWIAEQSARQACPPTLGLIHVTPRANRPSSEVSGNEVAKRVSIEASFIRECSAKMRLRAVEHINTIPHYNGW
jgi:hypothetical protein